MAWLFLRHTAVQLAIGLALGLAGALAAGRSMHAFLVGIEPRDVFTLTAVPILLASVTLVACPRAGTPRRTRGRRRSPSPGLRRRGRLPSEVESRKGNASRR